MSIVGTYFDLRVPEDEIFQFCKNVVVEMLLINCEDNADLEDIDKEFEKTEKIFVSFFSGSTIEQLHVVQITGKGLAEGDISDPYGHFVWEVCSISKQGVYPKQFTQEMLVPKIDWKYQPLF